MEVDREISACKTTYSRLIIILSCVYEMPTLALLVRPSRQIPMEFLFSISILYFPCPVSRCFKNRYFRRLGQFKTGWQRPTTSKSVRYSQQTLRTVAVILPNRTALAEFLFSYRNVQTCQKLMSCRPAISGRHSLRIGDRGKCMIAKLAECGGNVSDRDARDFFIFFYGTSRGTNVHSGKTPEIACGETWRIQKNPRAHRCLLCVDSIH